MSDGSGSSSGSARPLQVTVAGITATTACLLLVLALIDAMTNVRSVESQDSVRRFLSTPPGSSLGLAVSEVISILRGLVLFSGALAAAGAVLGAYTLRRHRGARVGLSVVALLMMFTTTFVAGLLPFFVAVAATMLWRKEARDWFDGKPPAPREAPPERARVIPPPGVVGGAQGASPAPNPYAGPAPSTSSAVHAGTGPPAPYAGPGSHAVHAAPGSRPPRPGAVTAAALLTWVFSAITALVLLVVAIVLVGGPADLVQAFQREPQVAAEAPSADQLLAAMWMVVGVGLFWCLAAIALAALAFYGLRAGQVGVIVSAACAALFALVASTSTPGFAALLWLLLSMAAIATVVLLLRPESRRFFAGRSTHAGPPPGSGPPWGAPPGPTDQQPGQGSGRPPVW